MKNTAQLPLIIICLLGVSAMALAAPPVELSFDGAPYIHRAGANTPIHFKLRATNCTADPHKATIHLSPSSAFRLILNAKERSIPVEFSKARETQVIPLNLPLEEGIGQRDVYLSAVVEGQAEAVVARVRVIDLKTAPNQLIAVIEAKDNTVAQTLARLNIPHEAIAQGAITADKLKTFSAVIVDGSAYNAREDLAGNNAALLDYAKNGGTVVVMGHAAQWKSCYAPYPFKAAAKNAAKDTSVKVLAPDHALFKTPNAIDAWDWEGWTIRQAIDLPAEWDKQYTALVDCGGPGAVLVCKHGTGTYVYTALGWTEQLSDPHPGALRLFANLVALGRAG